MNNEVDTNSQDFMLSSVELSASSEFNENVNESSQVSLENDSLINLSLTLNESETAKLRAQRGTDQSMVSVESETVELDLNFQSQQSMETDTASAESEAEALKQKQMELELEYARLRTIQEESSEAIELMDDTECTEQIETTANNVTIFTSEHESESMIIENTLQNVADERSFFQHTLLELGRRLWKSTKDEQHYTKGCLWSPDGTCLLVPVHLDGMHVMELPQDLYNMNDINPARNISKLSTAVHVKEGGTVYDVAWYPFMNSTVPDSCCWLATRQHEPIHLFDAFNGELRCSYRGYDQVDEVEAAISVAFSNNGERVIGGYKKSIKIFDTIVPGRDFDSIPVKKAVACFALSTQNEETLTTGSWNGYIDHYDLRARQIGSLFTLSGHDAGITCIKYSKSEPIMLFSGARRDNKILQWDMRNFKQPLRKFQRNVSTNQRIYFDLSPQEEWLVSGDTCGLLRIWDLKAPTTECLAVPIHKDCCNGVSFNPTLPILATSAGQYHFVDGAGDVSLQNGDAGRKIVKYENSVIILGINSLKT